MKFLGPRSVVQSVTEGETLIFTACTVPRGVDITVAAFFGLFAVLVCDLKLWALGALALSVGIGSSRTFPTRKTFTLRVSAAGCDTALGFYSWNSFRTLEYRAPTREVPEGLRGIESTWPASPIPLLLYANRIQCEDVIRKVHDRFPGIVFGSSSDGPETMLREVLDMFHRKSDGTS
jgi:hypothetical protein